MKHIRMLKHAHQLNPGELAGFEDSVADALVKSGHGEEYTPEIENKAEKKTGAKAEEK